MSSKLSHEEKLHNFRHSLAHILAGAIARLYDNVKFGTGPVTENGFFYDIDMDTRLAPEDLKRIEKEMRRIIRADYAFERSDLTIQDAKKKFEALGQSYKTELIGDFENEGEKTVSVYTSGDFEDLCRGGHVDRTSAIPEDCFKLTRVAGAYWKSDESREQLQRISGIAFLTKADLDAYEAMLKEAEKRDHRKIGQELDLFTFSDLVGSGLPLFTPKGTLLRDLIVEKIQHLQSRHGYHRVTIPHITKKDLYETSGHWEKFGDELFKVRGQSDQEFVMKPMNCPHHTQIYASHPRSYRELPIRYMESTMVYRDEQAGELLGLSRVRSISQDDGHVFCKPEDIEQEIKNIVSVIREFYTSIDMFRDGNYWVSVSVRDPKTPEKYLGDPKNWDRAEAILAHIVKEEKLEHKRVEGEAAFYGPKLDFMFKDAIGRQWQLATAQLDFVMPERFGLEYTDQTGKKATPVMIHRAIAGSLERFLSVLIEHYAGAFPLWLSPVQVAVIPVSEKFLDYARSVEAKLEKSDIRVELMGDGESLGKRIRTAQKQKIPAMLILGEKEQNDKTVTLRRRDSETQEVLAVDALITELEREIQKKE